MRHGFRLAKLSRSSSHRKALLRNLTTQLVEHERIRTTLAKAKALRKPAERLITYAKRDTPQGKSLVQGWLTKDELIPKVLGPLRERYAERSGGYTRVLKAGMRKTDRAEMAYIEFVDNGLPPLRFTKAELEAMGDKVKQPEELVKEYFERIGSTAADSTKSPSA